MKEFLLFLAGVITTSVGYLIRRKFERSSILEDLDIQLKLLEMNKQMKEQNVTEEELQKMRDRLPSAKPSKSGIIEFAQATPELKTQAQMYEFADKEFRMLGQELDITLKALSTHKSDAWKKQLDQSQQVWLEYRNRQAQLASDRYKGGTIAPFVYITEASGITKNRISELRMMLAP